MSNDPHNGVDSAKGAESETHFGFKTVKEEEKAGLVRDVFDSVAGRYDLMNDLMSGGLHRLWKNSLIDSLNPQPGMRFLDVAGGTGDIAFRIRNALTDNDHHITVLDINASMLEVGRARAIDKGWLDRMTWTCGDAETLPLPDKSVDAYTIAFGIRNVTHIETALAEAQRVLRPGGRFLCLEFSHKVLPGLKSVYDTYSFEVLPRLGDWITGDAESYQYLAESIRKFPSPEKFAEMIGNAGLEQVGWRSMTGGIVALHSAWRI